MNLSMREKMRHWISRGFSCERGTVARWTRLQASRPGVSAPIRVIDLGCGVGVLADVFEPTFYCGLDIDAEAIAAARRLHPTYDFKIADLRDPEMAMLFREVSVVVCNGVLHHLADTEVERLLETIVAMTPPSASLIAIEPVLPPWTRPVGRLLAAWDRGAWIRKASHLEALMAAAGMRLAGHKRISFWPRYPIPSNAYWFWKKQAESQDAISEGE